MVRKLSLMLVLTLGFVPLAAQALGLGDIQPKSALNQVFNAEIKLISVAKGQIDDIKAGVASEEAFKRSGVDRTFLLSKLRFKPELKADGTAVIKVTSSDPIREPFLNFLVEVNWPKGRLVREYTVLLDPPVTLERKPAPIKAPAVSRKRIASPKIAPKPPVRKATPRPAQKRVLAVQPTYAGPLDEVHVQKNASLWTIARKHKHPDVDQYRMMMAIYHANPRAFIRSNMNKLKRGAILRIPDKEDILALRARDAQREYKQHVDAWHADGDVAGIIRQSPIRKQILKQMQESAQKQVPQAEPKPDKEQIEPVKSVEKGSPKTDTKSETGAKTETETEAETKTVKEIAEAEGELKIATARPEGKGEAGPSEDSEANQTISRLKQELLIVDEDAERLRGEGEELASRVDDLENQLEDLDRILELKSEQLAVMQAALAKSTAEAESLKNQVDTAAKPAVAAGKSSPEVATEKADKEIVKEKVKPELKAEKAKTESVVKPIAKAEKKPFEANAGKKPVEEPSLFDEVLGNPTMLGIVVAVIIILLGLVWILLSRKRSNSTGFQESILLNTDDDVTSVLDDAEDIPGHTEETSFLSDFSPSDIDALQDETGEVDPLSEADVYIAYGRYQQAEELIRQAIDKEPERWVLKHKLFEILYAVKNGEDFVDLAEESAGTQVETGDRSSWTKVLSMGKALLPEHPMFSSADDMDADDDMFSLDEELLDDELDENDFADLDATLTQTDFEIGKESTESETKTETEDGQQDDDLSDALSDTLVNAGDTANELDDFEFDTSLDDDSLSTALDELDDQVVSDGEQSEADDDLMLSLSDLEDESEKTVEKTVRSLNAASSMEDDTAIDLSSELDLDIEEEPSSLEHELLANELEDTVIDFSEGEAEELGLELDEPVAGLDLAGDGGVGIDMSDAEDMQDEVKTKLDLARAYAEMGDKDGALDILDEVLSEGDDSQKSEAQQIKDSLS